MIFQASDSKGKQFLNLLDSNDNIIELSYIKEESWLKFISHSNLLCASVVATTWWNGTCDMLTSTKLSVGYLVVGITRELNKKPSLHCYPIYISYRWSMLQQYVYLMSTLQ